MNQLQRLEIFSLNSSLISLFPFFIHKNKATSWKMFTGCTMGRMDAFLYLQCETIDSIRNIVDDGLE